MDKDGTDRILRIGGDAHLWLTGPICRMNSCCLYARYEADGARGSRSPSIYFLGGLVPWIAKQLSDLRLRGATRVTLLHA